MKLNLLHKIIIAFTAALLIFTIGFAIGRSKGETVINITVSELDEKLLYDLSGSDSEFHITVNVNTADLQELQLLPGVDAELAESILTHRNTLGKFTDLSQLKETDGMGFITWLRIKSLIIL